MPYRYLEEIATALRRSRALLFADVAFEAWGERVVEDIEELGVLDGYVPKEEETPLPQVERKLIIRVDKIIDFSHAPHIDVEE